MAILNHSDLVDNLAQFDTDHASDEDLQDVYYEQSYKYWEEQDTSELYDRAVELGIVEYDEETAEFYT